MKAPEKGPQRSSHTGVFGSLTVTAAPSPGFDFDVADEVPETLAPDGEELERLRAEIAPEIAKTYPDFAKRMFG